MKTIQPGEKMKLILIAFSLLSLEAFSLHHETVFQVWCKTGNSSSSAIKALNKHIASGGHGLHHHLKIKSVSAPSITTESHSLHHKTMACATITAVKDH